MSFLAIATDMAKRGVHVTPTYRGMNSPRKPGWTGTEDWYAATTDLRTIEAWSREDPNFNCCCVGKPDGACILDIDDLAAAEKRGMPQLPQTFTVRSPSGGLHVYFSQNALSRSLDNRNVYDENKVKIVEIKNNNTAVCSPGCVREDGGTYVIVVDAPLAKMPMELYEWLLKKWRPR